MEQQSKKIVYKKWHIVVIVLAVIVFIWSMGGDNNSSNKSSTIQSEFVSSGENGYISVSSPTTIIALTEIDFKNLIDSYSVGDTDGVAELLMSGRVFSVNNGTEVLVIDRNIGSSKVRILEGEQSGRSGWIIMEWISKTK